MREFNIDNVVFSYIDENTKVDEFDFSFCVGHDDLKKFINEGALEWQNDQIASTIIAFHNELPIGFVTYGIDSVKHEYPDAMDIVNNESNVCCPMPALRVHWLAVSKEYRSNGIGTKLMEHILQTFQKLRKIVPCPQIVVQSYEDAVVFYEKFGFETASKYAQRNYAPLILMFAAFREE